MRASLWPATFVCSVLLFLPASAASAVSSFDASLVPSGPLEVSGELAITDQSSWLMDVYPDRAATPPADPIVTGGRAAIIIDEYRWSTVADASTVDGAPLDVPGSAEHSSDFIEASSVVATSLEASRDAHWILQPVSKQAASKVLNARCEVRPEPATAQRIDLPSPLASRVWPARLVPFVSLDCDIGDVGASGPVTYWFDESRILVEGLHDSGAFARTVETGRFDSADPDKPGQTQHLHRVLRIAPDPRETEAFRSTFSLPDTSIQVRSPAVALAGSLRVPQSTGYVHWGPLAIVDDVAPFTATGAFTLRATDGRTLHVQGASTFSGSVAPRSDVAASVPWQVIGPAAAAGLGALGLAWFARRVLMVFLFSRLDGGRILEHPVRRLLVDAVDANPGLSIRDLAKTLDMPRGTVRHHLDLLVRRGLLHRVPGGRERRIFLAHAEPGVVPLSHRGGEVLAFLRRNPVRSQLEIVRGLHASRTSVSRWLRRLQELGYIRVTGRGRRRQYAAAPDHPRVEEGA